MSEARNVIVLILVLLFIFVGVGVAISRLNKASFPQGSGANAGILKQIFGDASSASGSASTKPSITPTPQPGKMVVTQESSSDTVYSFQGVPTVTPRPTKSAQQAAVSQARPNTTTVTVTTPKGGQPEQIPSTGAHPGIILLALIGLGSGLYLHRKA